MKRITRRSALLAGAGMASMSAATGFQEPLGLEIYSLRRNMQKDIPGTLASIRRMGFSEVEVPGLYGLSAEQFRKALDAAGLEATAMVAQYESLSKDLSGVQKDAHKLGAKWVLFPWIPHSGPLTLDDVHRVAKEMNSWTQHLAMSGLGFAYHPHGYEFRPSPDGTLFDTLMKETDPASVFFEMDTFWIALPGQDCVALLARYGRRFRLLHLKDLRAGAEIGSLSGQAPDEDSVTLGKGVLPWPAILRQAAAIGIERYYIEDESPDAASQIPASLRYIYSLKL